MTDTAVEPTAPDTRDRPERLPTGALNIDPRIVYELASIQCTMLEMAAVVGCSVDTLERRFADVIAKGREHGKASLRRLQWASAKKGNTAMQIWLGKQHLGQKDVHKIEAEGMDGRGIEAAAAPEYNFDGWSLEEMKAFELLNARALSSGIAAGSASPVDGLDPAKRVDAPAPQVEVPQAPAVVAEPVEQTPDPTSSNGNGQHPEQTP